MLSAALPELQARERGVAVSGGGHAVHTGTSA